MNPGEATQKLADAVRDGCAAGYAVVVLEDGVAFVGESVDDVWLAKPAHLDVVVVDEEGAGE